MIKKAEKDALDAAEKEKKEAEARQLKSKAAITISVLALTMIAVQYVSNQQSKISSGAGAATTNSYNFFQAKNARQAIHVVALDTLKSQTMSPNLTPNQRVFLDGKIEEYTQKIQRYASDPATGEGKKELLEEAKRQQAVAAVASKKNAWFGFAQSSLQIAIVIASSAFIAGASSFFVLSYIVGAVGVFLALNGWFLFF